MVKSFWGTLAGHFESFSCCLEQVFSRESVESALASIEKNSKGDVTSGILKTLKVFKNTQDCSLQAYNLLKKTSIQIPSWIFSASSRASSRNLVSGSFLVGLQTLDCKLATPAKIEYLEIPRRATFRNMPFHVSEFLKELKNAEMSLVPFSKR